MDPMVDSADQDGWVARPLPRGRHRLTPDEVQASQRERLLQAMAEVVAERGYDGASVPRVIAAARVSSNTFYRFFTDKADCFVALCEQLGDELRAALEVPATPAGTPAAGLEALDHSLERYLAWWQERPMLARVYFVELPTAGLRALEERERQSTRFGTAYRRFAERARAYDDQALPLREIDVTAAAILTRELVAREIRAGRVDHLTDLRDDLRYLLLRLLVSDRAARFAATRGDG
jgi:AcrR family transcriptional regulator